MTSETLNRYNSAMALVKNFKIDVFLKKISGLYLVKYGTSEQKMAYSVIYKPKGV
jgi:hypothetical protein